jgi:hypothetical protein
MLLSMFSDSFVCQRQFGRRSSVQTANLFRAERETGVDIFMIEKQ